MKRQEHNERYLGDRCLLDELKAIGHVRHLHPQPNTLEPHIHTAEFEFCYIVNGTTTYWTDEGHHVVSSGQYFMTLPAELHGGVNTTSYPRDMYWFQVVIPEDKPFSGMSVSETEELREKLYRIRNRVITASVDPLPLYERILSCVRADTDFRMLNLRLAVHELLLCIIHDSEVNNAVGSVRDVPCLSIADRAKKWIDEHLTEDFNIDDIAVACDVSASYLRKEFKRKNGLTPADYRMVLRIAKAKQLLKETSKPVTEIGIELGFSSSQYFATTFKSHTGMNPYSFRQLSNQNSLPYRFVPNTAPSNDISK